MVRLFLRCMPKYSMYRGTAKVTATRVEYGAPDTIRTCDRLVRSQIYKVPKRLIFGVIRESRFYAYSPVYPQCYQSVTPDFYAPALCRGGE